MGQILLLVQGAEAAGGTPGLTFSFGLGKPWHFPSTGKLFSTQAAPRVEEQVRVPIVVLSLPLLQAGGGTSGT